MQACPDYMQFIYIALLQETWGHVEFKFTQHKGTDVFLVKMAEEDFEALEDNQVLVQVKSVPKQMHWLLLLLYHLLDNVPRSAYA